MKYGMMVKVMGLVLLGCMLIPILGQDSAKKQETKQELPKGEDELQRYWWQRRWQDPEAACRAIKKYLKDYPEGKHVANAVNTWGQIFSWGRLQHDRTTGRKFLRTILKRYKGKKIGALAQYWIAQLYQRDGNKDKALIEYRKLVKDFPGSQYARNATWSIMSLLNKSFQISVNQSFSDGQEAFIHLYMHNIEEADFKIYRVKPGVLVKRLQEKPELALGIAGEIERLKPEELELVREWSEDFTESDNYRHNHYRSYYSGNLKLGIDKSGYYLVEAKIDDDDLEDLGLVMKCHVQISKYGIITKTARDSILVFAQNRATGKPVKDMRIRIFSSNSKLVAEGKTDDKGLFVADKVVPNGVAIGIKDKEIITSRAYNWYRNRGQPCIYILTDRPIYRPNQTVFYKVILRQFKKDELVLPEKREVTVEIRDQKNNTVQKEKLIINEFGTASGSFTLGDEPPLGYYYIYTDLGGWLQFRVEEYRKPEYKVDVTMKGAPFIHGDQITAEINAQYYFGSPVVGADVEYIVYRNRYWWPWWWHSCIEWGGRGLWWYKKTRYGWRRHYYGGYYGRQEFTRGKGKTDKHGKLIVSFDTEEDLDYNAVYTVVAKVVDKSRREVKGTGRANVMQAAFSLRLTTDKYLYKPDERINVKVRAIDVDQQPVAGVSIDVVAYIRDWLPAVNQFTFDEFYSVTKVTDKDGYIELDITEEDMEDIQGYIKIVAEAEDKNERTVKVERGYWISDCSWGATFQNFHGLDIVADKDFYSQGDEARLLVTSQYKDIYALVTVEANGKIHSADIVHLKAHSRLYTLPIDIKKYSPNCTVTVSTIYKNQWLTKTRNLAVPPDHKVITVKITPDKSKYRPREKARYTIQTTDYKGNPVSAEVALGIVDESIYAIQDEFVEDIRKFFYSRRYGRVYTTTSLHQYSYGYLGEDTLKKAQVALEDVVAERPAFALRAKKEGFRKGRAAYAETEIRSRFADTMFWAAHLKTDASGKATVEVTIPDNLTTWRATVRAITMDTLVGEEKKGVICRKEIIIRLETPRFFTQKDRTVISAVVHNYRDDVNQIKVVLEAKGIEVKGKLEHILQIPKGQDRRIDWEVLIKKAGVAKLTAKALTRFESDAMQLAIPILAHGTPQYKVWAGMLSNQDTVAQKIKLPPDAIEGATELGIVISPTIGVTITDSLKYLATYPYGCMEQTMSRFIPCVVALQSLQRLGLTDEKLLRELPKMINVGLQRIYNFQQPDGGWGWWSHGTSHPLVTAYVLHGLLLAREADADVDQSVLRRGIRALRRLMDAAQDANSEVYMFYTLSKARNFKKSEKEDLLYLLDEIDDMNSYALAMLIPCLLRAGMKDRAKEVLKMLEEEAIDDEQSLVYWEAQKVNRGGWMYDQIETTAYALKAILAIKPDHPYIPGIIRWLASKRQGHGYYHTKDTAAVVYALTDYLAKSKELDPDYEIVLKVNGKELVREHITRQNMFKFDGYKLLKGFELRPENEVIIEKKGKGVLYYTVSLKYVSQAEDLEPTGVMEIERTYSLVTYDEDGERYVEELEEDDKVRSGDEILVTLRLSCDQNYQYVIIEDPLPSGCEVIRPAQEYNRWWWGYWYHHKEVHDEKVVFAVTHMWRGMHTITYTLRAETPGDFHVLPTRAYNMYLPEQGGTSAETRLKILDRK
jgi:hypothetical protein